MVTVVVSAKISDEVLDPLHVDEIEEGSNQRLIAKLSWNGLDVVVCRTDVWKYMVGHIHKVNIILNQPPDFFLIHPFRRFIFACLNKTLLTLGMT